MPSSRSDATRTAASAVRRGAVATTLAFRWPNLVRVSWDESAGKVTRAFDLWKATDRDIRAYLAFNARWVDPAYQELWAEAETEFSAIFDPDRHDVDGHVDLFHDKVGGLWPTDYLWKLRSDNLRDAVTAYEVYMEKSLEEVLSRYVVVHEDGTKSRLMLFRPKNWESPGWGVLVQAHAALGTNIEPEAVQYIRALRHLLAHQRGELRTEEQRDKFQREADPSDWMVGEAYVGGDVPLAEGRLSEMLDQLGDVVRSADPAAWTAAYGVEVPTALGALVSATRGPLVSVPLP